MTEVPADPDAPETAVSPFRLARAFNKVALESFGGGLGAWMRHLIVLDRRWLNEEEYISASTLCQILPGANQVNMAVFVGTRRAGALGAAAAVAGLLVIPAGIALLAGAALVKLHDDTVARRVLSGMSSASAGLTLSVAFRQGFTVLRGPAPAALTVATVSMVLIFRAPLWATLAACGLPGCWWAWRRLRITHR